jgi:hypothetical protein
MAQIENRVTRLGEFSPIGRLGNILGNDGRSANSWATFCLETSYVFFGKNGLGNTLGDFFTNSSGHPDRERPNNIPYF